VARDSCSSASTEIVETGARVQASRQRQHAQIGDRRLVRRRHRLDPDHQGGGVVLAAPGMGLAHQGAGGELGRVVQLHEPMQFLLPEGFPDTVAGQQEAVAPQQFAVAEVRHDMAVQPQGPLQHVGHAGRLPDMVRGELLEQLATLPIQAAVADMGEVVAASAQGQGGQGGGHAAGLVARGGLAREPAVDRRQHRGEGAGNLPGVGRGVEIGEQVAHRRLRRLAPVDAPRHPVRHRRQNPPGGGLDGVRRHEAAEVLVALARPGLRGVAEFEL
jgi:hypothetical protein